MRSMAARDWLNSEATTSRCWSVRKLSAERTASSRIRIRIRLTSRSEPSATCSRFEACSVLRRFWLRPASSARMPSEMTKPEALVAARCTRTPEATVSTWWLVAVLLRLIARCTLSAEMLLLIRSAMVFSFYYLVLNFTILFNICA